MNKVKNDKPIKKRQLVRIFIDRENKWYKDLVVCRNCGRVERFGNMINTVGHDACPECFDSLDERIETIRSNDYESYRNTVHFYEISDEDYATHCLCAIESILTHLNKQMDYIYTLLPTKEKS